MSANSGYNTGFSTIADDHLYLYVTNDRLFNTDIEYASVYSRNIVDEDSKEIQKILPYKINKELALKQINNEIQQNNLDKNTVYDIISSNPQLSEIKKFIDICGYQNILNEDTPAGITFFAPINGNYNKLFNYLNKGVGMYKEYKVGDITQLLKAHTTNFNIEPSRLIDIKNKVFTKIKNFSFFIEGTHDGLEIYQHNYVTYHLNPMKENNKIKVLTYISGSNGSLYLIDSPLIPDIIIA